MNTTDLRAPFPYFGGKRRVAPEVWAALGDVDNYVEPFAGSLAVLLGRPLHDDRRRTETVNDADGFIANFWRAVATDPEQVAHHADWPVNETDLFARHLWLVNGQSRLLVGLESDPDWYDAKVAGWWVWGLSSWIGGGWCDGRGPWNLSGDGTVGKHQAGEGVNRQRPHLSTAQGVNREMQSLTDYMLNLAHRLRDTRVCCGDWSRVTTRGALAHGDTIGVFLDPPYLGDVRTKDIYAVDDHTIAHDVRDWCLANGDNPRYRIVLAGYTTEHDHLIPPTWRRHYWSASGSYATAASAQRAREGATTGNLANRHKECLWMSPACLDPAPRLFDIGARA